VVGVTAGSTEVPGKSLWQETIIIIIIIGRAATTLRGVRRAQEVYCVGCGL
jgi:hypothetical protein